MTKDMKSGRPKWVVKPLTFNATEAHVRMVEELEAKAKELDPTITRTRVLQDALAHAHKSKIYG